MPVAKKQSFCKVTAFLSFLQLFRRESAFKARIPASLERSRETRVCLE